MSKVGKAVDRNFVADFDSTAREEVCKSDVTNIPYNLPYIDHIRQSITKLNIEQIRFSAAQIKNGY